MHEADPGSTPMLHMSTAGMTQKPNIKKFQKWMEGCR